MEKHQAGQEETLVEVKMEMDSQPRGSPADRSGCFKCVVALAIVMGLVIVAVMAGFILHVFMFSSSCNQDAGPPSATAKVNITRILKESDEKGRYDIFTTDKAGTYLIYGWVKISDNTSEEIILQCTWENTNRTIQKKHREKNETEIFSFFDRVQLANNSRMSIYFKSICRDSSVHVYEL
eukprot:superscaffoldBa00000747_g6966